MTKLRLQYIHEFRDRHGRVRHYFRRRGFKTVPLPGLPGSSEFMSAYQAALDSAPPTQIGAKRTKPGSVNAALVAYYTSLEFRSLAAGTQLMRRQIYERFREQHGDKSISTMPPKFIANMLSPMPPHAARNWLKAIRALAQFCVAQEMIAADPTQGVKLPRAKSDGHHSWTDLEIERFEKVHAIGTKARLALALGIYTMQRRGDVVRLGPQHIRDGFLSLRQQKTSTPLTIPVHPTLRAILDATPTKHLTFLVTELGRPFSAKGFGNWFRNRCDEAGLPHCTFHGLRKAGATRLADAGCSEHEIAAWGGWKSLSEVQRYTKAASQKRLASAGLAKIMRTDDWQPGQNEVATPLISKEKK
jgi:integrase